MSRPVFPASQRVELIFLGLQVFQVLFLWLHDWLHSVDSTMSPHYVVKAQCYGLSLRLLSRVCRSRLVYYSASYTLDNCTHTGCTFGFWSATASSLQDNFVLGGDPIFFKRNLNGPPVIKSCSAIPTISCQFVMDLSRTPRISCFTLQPLPRCLSCL
jgi:hypothetical protein